jgi:hypothetical protein
MRNITVTDIADAESQLNADEYLWPGGAVTIGGQLPVNHFCSYENPPDAVTYYSFGIVNDEDFIQNKKERLILRRKKKKSKQRGRWR